MKRLGIVGASGQVGATLTEHFVGNPGVEVVPFIHTSGNAWRLARRGIALKSLDLLDRDSVHASLAGFTHVVNCSRGSEEAMTKGLENLLDACLANNVQRVVHLSSVLVYGDPPDATAVHESAPTTTQTEGYGALKLVQDRLVEKAAGKGLPAIILCPPNITGPHSAYLLNLFRTIMGEEFALVDDRPCPCNVVDVHNLVHAIELALEHGPRDGSRFFVTDDETVDWSDLIQELCATLDDEPRLVVPRIGAERLARLAASSGPPRGSLGRSIRHLASSDVRAALRQDPYLAAAERTLRGLVAKVGKSADDRLRRAVSGPMAVQKADQIDLNLALCAQQLRGVRHSCDALKNAVGYSAKRTFRESMGSFRRWYRTVHGVDTPCWDLLRALG